MQLSANDIYVSAGVLAFFVLILLGIKKFHMIEKYKMLSRKEKGITICLFLLFLGAISIVISLNEAGNVPADGKIGMVVGGFLEKLYNNNCTMILVVKYILIQIPALLVLIFSVSRLVEWGGLGILPIYYITLFAITNRETYRIVKSSWEEALLLLVLGVILLGIADCLNNVFTRKKMLFLVVLAVIFIGIELTVKGVDLQAVRFGVELLVETCLMGIIVKYGRFLRKGIRKVIKLIYIIVIVYINYKFL